MRKNRMMRLASILLVCVLLTTSVISGTFAKYTSEATATSTATVANWSFDVAGTDITNEATFTVDLFTTISDDESIGTDDENVEDGKIAPGTGGSFNLAIENTSEVAAKYTITLEGVDDEGVPLQFSKDQTTWYDIDDATNPELFSVTSDTLAVGSAAVNSAPIYWRWVFTVEAADGTTTARDTADTALGNDPVAPVVTVKVVAEQVD